MSNLFIIRSPLQLINAIEARHHFKTQNNILCIIHNTSTVNSSHIYKVLSLTKWEEVIEINPKNKKNSLLKNIQTIKHLQKKSLQYIFTGDIGNINTAFISSLTKQETYLLDDGTMTLISYNTINNPHKKEKWAKFLKRNRYRLFGLKCNLIKEKINYFTLFDLEVFHNEKIIKNEFSFFKENYLPNLTKQSNTVYFIGQNLIVENIMSEITYLQYIKNIIHFYKGKKIIYYPHRFEKISNAYSKLENKNFIIKETVQPIEVELLTQSNYPMYIASFVSSALSSLQHIFQDANIHSFIIKNDDLLSHKENFKLIYENQHKNIQQIQLNSNEGDL